MKITLPDHSGRMVDYTLAGTPIASAKLGANPARVVYSAAHVVAGHASHKHVHQHAGRVPHTPQPFRRSERPAH